MFNNLNNVQQVKLRLKINNLYATNEFIDANFIRKYILSDEIVNLTHLDFYIISKCSLMSNNIEKIIKSFKTHPVFIERQCSNVKCFVDTINCCLHLSSSRVRTLDLSLGLE